MRRWFEEELCARDVVISSRVRLARNLENYPFSMKLTEKEAKRMVSEVGKTILLNVKTEEYRDYLLEELTKDDIDALLERGVITKYLASQKIAMLFVSEDEKTSIMLNEEDHIRIQCQEAGLNLEAAFAKADKIDDILGDKVRYAYDDNLGYLTSCPSNVGTGMKATVIMHLPALTNTKKIQPLINEVARFGVSMKGIYGEDGSGCGHLYQLSSVKTLGLSEKEIINNLKEIVSQISNQELECRKNAFMTDRSQIEDEIYKSYGILKYSRRLKYKDAMMFLSEIRLGLMMDILRVEDETDFVVYQLMMGILPANMKFITGKDMDEDEMEEIRANFIRENLPNIY